MILSTLKTLVVILCLTAACAVTGEASGLLDGKVFRGMIGPAEKLDLSDSLYFDEGYFWSDICTQCGFVPGTYTAEATDVGIVFRGTLKSESRGRFDYEGTVGTDGSIIVSIAWERRRWYWTSKRQIVFEGELSLSPETISLSGIRHEMQISDTVSNPICARF